MRDEMTEYYALGLERDRLAAGAGALELARTQRLLERHLPPARRHRRRRWRAGQRRGLAGRPWLPGAADRSCRISTYPTSLRANARMLG